MSDLNLENIVGFKAVDKNGNERQVTVDEMTELVSARIVSAASEISTFAAAAAAGTDEFEDQLPQSDTFSWLRTLDGSKNPTLTSSSAAAKVLGELIGINETWFRNRGYIRGEINLDDFKNVPEYANSFVIKYSTIIMSISQISETLFILAIPFFLKRFGIKNVMLISMLAWVLRFGLFGLGNPAEGLWMIILSCIVYGMAFDFFNISGSLFVETTTDPSMRSSAQGLFMMMTNGFGAIIGSSVSGFVIQNYFTHNGLKDWHSIWLTFAAYSLVVAVLFALFFKHKHESTQLQEIKH